MTKRIQLLVEQATRKYDRLGNEIPFAQPDLELFAQLIVTECIAQCEQVAADADAMTKSKFVTDAGRRLHEGMWGGAKNCGAGIKEHFFGELE